MTSLRELRALVQRLGLEEDVRFLGYVPDGDVAPLYAETVALVMPTFDMPVLEAWGLGCPVLTSDIRGIREHVGDAAMLVEPRSVEGVAAGMRKLWTDEGAAKPPRGEGAPTTRASFARGVPPAARRDRRGGEEARPRDGLSGQVPRIGRIARASTHTRVAAVCSRVLYLRAHRITHGFSSCVRGPAWPRTSRSFAFTPSPTHRSIPGRPRYRHRRRPWRRFRALMRPPPWWMGDRSRRRHAGRRPRAADAPGSGVPLLDGPPHAGAKWWG
jgi:hypothetical protein